MKSGHSAPHDRPRRRRSLLRLLLPIVIMLLLAGAVAVRSWLTAKPGDAARLDLLQAALKEFAAQHYAQATELLDRRTREVAPTALDWMLRARIAEAQGRLADAVDYLRRIPDTDPIAPQASLKAGQIEIVRGRARAAETALLQSITLAPDSVQARRELAYLYTIQRRWAECDAQFRALNRIVSMDYVLAFAWCQNDCDLWDPHEARKQLTKFIEVDPTDRFSRLALTVCLHVLSRFSEAETAIAPLPESDPEARALRVQFAIERGDIETAETLANDGPADHAKLNILRGDLARYHGLARKAESYYRAALEKEPDARDAIHGLGLALRQLGDPAWEKYLKAAATRDEMKRSIKASANMIKVDIKLYCKLGELCESIGHLAQARVWYRLAIKVDPLDTTAHQGLARLEKTTSGKNPVN
jgi:predicted Zn-dependent protease